MSSETIALMFILFSQYFGLMTEAPESTLSFILLIIRKKYVMLTHRLIAKLVGYLLKPIGVQFAYILEMMIEYVGTIPTSFAFYKSLIRKNTTLLFHIKFNYHKYILNSTIFNNIQK